MALSKKMNMYLTEASNERIRRGIYTLGLSTSLIGGHMVASYLLLDVGHTVLDYYGYATLGLVLLNSTTFIISIVLQLTKLANTHKIMNAAFGLLLNIPVAFIYLIVLIIHGT